MSQTSLVVCVPEAEVLVANLRQQYDPAASLGMPAHIMLMYPFAPLQDFVHAAVFERLQDIANRFTVFDFSLASVGRFPRVAYLQPEPATPFIALTQAVWNAFAQYRTAAASGGSSGSAIVPHVTAANGSAQDADLAQR